MSAKVAIIGPAEVGQSRTAVQFGWSGGGWRSFDDEPGVNPAIGREGEGRLAGPFPSPSSNTAGLRGG